MRHNVAYANFAINQLRIYAKLQQATCNLWQLAALPAAISKWSSQQLVAQLAALAGIAFPPPPTLFLLLLSLPGPEPGTVGQFGQFVQSEVALYVAARRTLRLFVCLSLCVRACMWVCAISKCLIIVHNIASFSGLLFGFLFVAFALLAFLLFWLN